MNKGPLLLPNARKRLLLCALVTLPLSVTCAASARDTVDARGTVDARDTVDLPLSTHDRAPRRVVPRCVR